MIKLTIIQKVAEISLQNYFLYICTIIFYLKFAYSASAFICGLHCGSIILDQTAEI